MKLKIMISCLIGIICLNGCSIIPNKITKSEEIIRTVEIKEVINERNNITLDYLGAIIVNDERILFTDVSGTINKVSISAGKEVSKDDPLIEVKQKDNSIWDTYSDVDGYVKEIMVEVDTTIEVGDPMVSINTYNHRVALGITSKDIKKIKIGTKVKVTFDGIETMGRVCLLSPYPDEVSRTFPAQIELIDTYEKGDYIVGAVTEIELIVGEEEGIYLDINNILNEGNQYVYVVDEDNRAKKQKITVKGYGNNKVLVEGLNEGDRVIVSGTSNLKEGQKVIISGRDEVDM